MPPAGAALGDHTVYGYFSDAAGADGGVDSAQAPYTIDAPPTPTPGAGSPPALTVVTLAATAITDHTAILHGTLNPLGCARIG